MLKKFQGWLYEQRVRTPKIEKKWIEDGKGETEGNNNTQSLFQSN